MLRPAIRIGLLLLVCVFGASVFLAEGALHIPERPQARAAYAEAFARSAGGSVECVRATASDGALLDAWLFNPKRPNGGAVIVLHGGGDTRLGVMSQAKFLLDAGYTVLAPDSRGHGASGGEVVTYGVLESEDVHRWADLLLRRSGIERLYGAGQSMGAAILIEALASEPRFRAIVADCPFATFEEIAYDRLSQHGASRFMAAPLVTLGLFYARERYGVDLRQASPAGALAVSTTPVLFIHGSADTNVPLYHSRELHALRAATTELWVVPGARHVESVSREPAEYAARVTRFFAEH
jgi:dipeptidyl aminopeptidase/acylaminoacyl peptidase